MKRTLFIAPVCALVLVSGASAVESTIVPNVGIGNVKLGMTLAHVKRILGPSPLVNKRAQLPGRRGYVEYGWDFSTNRVGFVNTKGVLHAVLVATSLRAQRMPNGVGVGTALERLRRTVRVVACELKADGRYNAVPGVPDEKEPFYAQCLFGLSTPRVTVFSISCTRHDVFYCPGYRVGEVAVRDNAAAIPRIYVGDR